MAEQRSHPIPYDGPAPGEVAAEALGKACDALDAIAALEPEKFATGITLVEADGVITATVAMNDGTSFSDTVTLPEDAPDVSLNGVTVGADGCTLTFTLANSTDTYTANICDVISSVTDNGDGTFTHTAGDGTEVTWCAQENPVVSCEIINDTEHITYKDGSRVKSYTDQCTETLKLSLQNSSVDATVPEGAILGQVCTVIDVGDCGRHLRATTDVSSNINDFFEGSYVLRAQVSFTGPTGNFFNMATGGQDAVQYFTTGDGSVLNTTVRNLGEFSFTDWRDADVPEGPTEICFQVVVERNDIVQGEVPLGINDVNLFWLKQVKEAA